MENAHSENARYSKTSDPAKVVISALLSHFLLNRSFLDHMEHFKKLPENTFCGHAAEYTAAVSTGA